MTRFVVGEDSTPKRFEHPDDADRGQADIADRSRCVKNSENNPMQSSRTAAATDGLDRHGLDRNLDTSGKSAAQFHYPKIC